MNNNKFMLENQCKYDYNVINVINGQNVFLSKVLQILRIN